MKPLIDPTIASFDVSHEIQDQILTKVAHKMWQKELVVKHLRPYTTKSSYQYGQKLVGHKYDHKVDDDKITPRDHDEPGLYEPKNKELVDFYPNQQKNQISSFEFQ